MVNALAPGEPGGSMHMLGDMMQRTVDQDIGAINNCVVDGLKVRGKLVLET